jgi:death-on-curing protein
MIWLERRDVEAFHATLVAEFGGVDGLRDAGGLESALARPRNLVAHGKPSAFELAAAYAFGIAKNHPFVDGNKRTAFVASVVFLELNGYELRASEEDVVVTILALAAGEMSEARLAKWLAANTQKVSSGAPRR